MNTAQRNHSIPAFAENEVFALLDNHQRRGDGYASRLFRDPRDIIECHGPGQVDACFGRLSAGLAAGLHAVGLFGYELGYCLESRLRALGQRDPVSPLFTVVLFQQYHDLTAEQSDALIRDHLDPAVPAAFYNLRPGLRRPEYFKAVRRIKDYIRAGDVYQVNFTFKYLFRHFGSPLALYAALRERQRAPYGAFIRLPGRSVLSLSPELFFRKDGDTLTAKPMKGTMPRGKNQAADALLRARLQGDEKNRAENLMIVDLIRNDLGRIARLGSIRVEKLFEVEDYETVLQMTSTLTAKIDPETAPQTLFASLYPCGSVTGAPKIRAMQIIRELETADRGLYTGAIGYLGPDGDCRFNVAIRTVVLNDHGAGEMGIGSAITWGSNEREEYEECLLKASFLTGVDPGFQLIESLRHEAPAGFSRLELHLARLARSARAFGFRCNLKQVRAALLGHTALLGPGQAHKVRLLLDKAGRIEIDVAPLPPDPATAGAKQVVVSGKRTDSRNPLLRHKTTSRQCYESELGRLQKETGCYEVLFCNERGELTEGSRTNLFVQKKGKLYTPPLSCGLLNGIMRRSILEDGKLGATERVLTAADLLAAERIFVTNSVRGMLEVRYAEN